MKIVDLYWKCRRAIRKRQETIARVITTVLIVAMVAVIGYVSYTIVRDDAERAALANQEVDKTTIKANKKRKYGEDKLVPVAENDKFILNINHANGEISVYDKTTQQTWYSNPQNRAEDNNSVNKNLLNSQFIVEFMNIGKDGSTTEFNNYFHSVRQGHMDIDTKSVPNGVKIVYGFPNANVRIPIQYFLTEDGFQAEIVTKEIEGVGSNPWSVVRIDLLPYFGAADLEDEGYLFVPDGSGALIEYNRGKRYNQPYSEMVYGRNPTVETTEQEPVKETVSMPVFGAKTNDHAFFGMIVAGEGCSKINASTSLNGNAYNSSYNNVYPTAVLMEYNRMYKKGDANTSKTSYTIDVSKNLMDDANYAVRYFFLSGEKANYIGMAELYRDYLVKNNKLKDSELADKKYTVLDLVGAVSIKKYVMGIKKPVVTALTTYNDVCQIVKDLKAQGVQNLAINYIGALDSGLNNKMYNAVSPESVLGSKKEFKAMIEFLEKEGVLLFLESNPVDLYENGNGLTENGHSTKTFFDHYAFQYKYELDKNARIDTTRWHLLRPQLLSEVTEGFAKSAAKWNVNNVSFNRMGDTLYSYYYGDQYYASRTKALEYWAEALKLADDNSKYLMVHGGNVYCSPYADVITDVADTHSNFDMQDGAVPFYHVVFQGNTLLTGDGINTTVDYDYAFLKALETGTSLKYNLIYGDVSQLVGTDYNTMVSYSYSYWKDTIVEKSLALQEATAQFAGKEIVNHTMLADDVAMTEYESGSSVIVNYTKEAYTYNDQTVPARGYLVLTGGAK